MAQSFIFDPFPLRIVSGLAQDLELLVFLKRELALVLSRERIEAAYILQNRRIVVVILKNGELALKRHSRGVALRASLKTRAIKQLIKLLNS